jgi:7-cyano-7-deazaguanine synthase
VPRTKDRVCVLTSGGVESAALIAHFLKKRRRVLPVYVSGGYVWEKAELHWLKRLLKSMAAPGLDPLITLRLSAKEFSDGGSWSLTGRGAPGVHSDDADVYLPGRNILLLAKASVLCAREGISAAALGTLRSNPFPDAQPAFFRSYERALSAGLGKPFKVLTPFSRLKKREVIARAGPLPWEHSFSCLSPRGLAACGRCNKCEERRKAFA